MKALSGAAKTNATKKECPVGHKYDQKNTRTGSKGERVCKKCATARTRRWRYALPKGYRRMRELTAFLQFAKSHYGIQLVSTKDECTLSVQELLEEFINQRGEK